MSGHGGEHHGEHHAEAHAPHAAVAASHGGGRLKKGVTAVGNLADNIVSTPFRAAGIVANAGLDLADTFNNLGLRSAEINKSTNQQMRDIISESGRGTFWKRLLKVPVGASLAIGKGIEGGVRSIVTPLWHGVRDVVGTAKNFIFNTGRAVTYIPNINPADTYKFDKLGAREYEKKGWDRMKLMPWEKGGSASGDKAGEPATVHHVDTHSAVVAPAPVVHQNDARDQEIIALKQTITTQQENIQQQGNAIQDLAKQAKEQSKIETPEKNAGLDIMKQNGDQIRQKLDKALRKDYVISWDEDPNSRPPGIQKISLRHRKKEQRIEPEFVATVYSPGKMRVRYNPPGTRGSVEKPNHAYYLGEMDVDAFDTCIPAIVAALSPAEGKEPDFHPLEACGIKKIEWKEGDSITSDESVSHAKKDNNKKEEPAPAHH